jgi:EpsI family protein
VEEDWQPVFAGAQAELFASHPVDDQIVNFYVAYYWRQHDDAELIGWPNAVYDRKNWQLLEQAPQVALIGGEQREIAETRLRGPQRARRLTWHWYWVDRQFTANPLIAKLLQAKATLFGGDTRAAVVVLSVLEQPESRASRRAMQQFIDQASFLKPMLMNAAELQVESAAADSRR